MTTIKCAECGGDVPPVVVGRPRRFCAPSCSAAFVRESKRLARDIADCEREIAQAERRFDWWDGNAQRHLAAALTDELHKLSEQQLLRAAHGRVDYREMDEQHG